MTSAKLIKQVSVGAAGLLMAVSSQAQQEKKPNVIFLIADDIGYGDLSCYGGQEIRTPNVEKLANSGVRFTDAHAVAATSTPSRYSLFTGHYSWRRKDTGIAPGDAATIIKPEQITIADMFKDAGYVTGAIGKWHLGMGAERGKQDWNSFVSPGPNDIGFDYSFLMAATGDRVPCVWMENQRVYQYDPTAPIEVSYKNPIPGEPTGKEHPEMLTRLRPSVGQGHDQAIVKGISRIGYMKGGGKALWDDENIADTITVKAVEYITKHKKEPFFLYVGTNDIHVPRYPHPRFRDKSGHGYRGDALLQFDWTVGEIVKALKENGLLENTLIVLSSDNGPVVDDGYQDQSVEKLGYHKPWGDLRGGKYSNFEAGTRVPLIVSWPGKVMPGVSSALVSQIDLYASMASLVNQGLREGAAPDSQDYLQAFLGKDKKGREYVIEAASALSVYDGAWKYISPNKGIAYHRLVNIEMGNNPLEQLYDIKNDKQEIHNLYLSNPEKLNELKSILEKEKNK